MPMIVRHGAALHFELVGDGFPLLLLPGAAVDGSAWRTAGYVDDLASSFRCVLVDPPGMGRSELPQDRAAHDVGAIAASVVAIADEIGLRQFGIWGASAGGAAAIVVAVEHPERVAALIVSGWWTPYDPAEEGPYARRNAARFRADGIRAALNAACDAEGLPDTHWVRSLDADREAVARIAEGLLAYDWMARAAPEQILVPTLYIVGEREDDDGEAQAAAARAPRAEIVVLEGEGHVGAWLRTTAESLAVARDFLARVLPRS